MHTLIRNSWKSPFTAATLIALVTSACVDIEDLTNPPPPPGDSSESGADPSDATPDTTSDDESGGDTTSGESGGDTTSGESGDPPTLCGNAVLEPVEQCDDGVNDGSYGACNRDCSFAPYCGDGSLAENEGCDDGNQIEDDGCTVKCTLATCGDGIVQEGEQCDGLGPDAACPMPEFDGGLLQCTAACTLDTSACVGCGNGVLDGTEICDGADVGDASCEGLGFDDTSLGFAGGELACATNCLDFDTSPCTAATECGNGLLEAGEVCDAGELDGASCASLGFEWGALSCQADCQGFELAGCMVF